MVEFPLVARRSARGLRRRFRNLSQIPSFADINFASPNRHLTQADMWETSTFAASFHARLNVAPQREFGRGADTSCVSKRLTGGTWRHPSETLRLPAAIFAQFRMNVAG